MAGSGNILAETRGQMTWEASAVVWVYGNWSVNSYVTMVIEEKKELVVGVSLKDEPRGL